MAATEVAKVSGVHLKQYDRILDAFADMVEGMLNAVVIDRLVSDYILTTTRTTRPSSPTPAASISAPDTATASRMRTLPCSQPSTPPSPNCAPTACTSSSAKSGASPATESCGDGAAPRIKPCPGAESSHFLGKRPPLCDINILFAFGPDGGCLRRRRNMGLKKRTRREPYEEEMDGVACAAGRSDAPAAGACRLRRRDDDHDGCAGDRHDRWADHHGGRRSLRHQHDRRGHQGRYHHRRARQVQGRRREGRQ